jgi:hypothetical protein
VACDAFDEVTKLLGSIVATGVDSKLRIAWDILSGIFESGDFSSADTFANATTYLNEASSLLVDAEKAGVRDVANEEVVSPP